MLHLLSTSIWCAGALTRHKGACCTGRVATVDCNGSTVQQCDGEMRFSTDEWVQVFPKMDGNPAKVAVENMSVAVASGECFGCGEHLSSVNNDQAYLQQPCRLVSKHVQPQT